MLRILISVLVLFIALTGCNKPETQTLDILDIELCSDGPVFEGPNSQQADVNEPLKEFLKTQGINNDKLESASIKELTLRSDSLLNFDLYSSIKIQFVSEKTDMIEAATINNIPKGSKELKLTLSGKQEELAEVLKQDNFTVLADVTLIKDAESLANIKCNIKFELKLK